MGGTNSRQMSGATANDVKIKGGESSEYVIRSNELTKRNLSSSTSTDPVSNINARRQKDENVTSVDSAAEKAIDFLGCSCTNSNSAVSPLSLCDETYNVIHKDDTKIRKRKMTTSGPSLLERKLQQIFPMNRFDLNVMHPTSPPFLGARYWQPIEEAQHSYSSQFQDEEENKRMGMNRNDFKGTPETEVMDVSLPGNEHSINLSPISSPTDKNEIVSSPAFLLQTVTKVDTPRVLSFGNDSIGCSTLRTATTTSTDEDENNRASNFNASSLGSSIHNGKDVEITFTPRRLFGDSQEKERQILRHHYDNNEDDDDDTNILNAPPLLFQAAYPACNTQTIPTTPDRISLQSNSTKKAIQKSRTQFCFTLPCANNNDTDEGEGLNFSSRSSILHDSPSCGGDESIIIRNGVLVKGKTTISTSSSYSQSSLNTMYIPDGVCQSRKRHVNTLPSYRSNKPLRLSVVESYTGYSSGIMSQDEQDDYGVPGKGESRALHTASFLSEEEYQQHFFSYDPYFSSGQYTISTFNGKPYGNGLSVKMGTQYMTLQDRDGRVWAVTRSRHTFVPSHVIYSPKERYPGQIPSSHCPITDEPNMSGDGYHGNGGMVDLYPWALVKKEGRRMDHDVNIHLAVKPPEGGTQLLGGVFDTVPTYRSRHGFDGADSHSHSVVFRIERECGGGCFDASCICNDGSDGVAADVSSQSLLERISSGLTEDAIEHGVNVPPIEKEIACCLILRDPINRDMFDITIAPGIDPLLIICYLAVHSKMDVEPKLCDQ